jgi:hypothetical protein
LGGLKPWPDSSLSRPGRGSGIAPGPSPRGSRRTDYVELHITGSEGGRLERPEFDEHGTSPGGPAYLAGWSCPWPGGDDLLALADPADRHRLPARGEDPGTRREGVPPTVHDRPPPSSPAPCPAGSPSPAGGARVCLVGAGRAGPRPYPGPGRGRGVVVEHALRRGAVRPARCRWHPRPAAEARPPLRSGRRTRPAKPSCVPPRTRRAAQRSRTVRVRRQPPPTCCPGGAGLASLASRDNVRPRLR